MRRRMYGWWFACAASAAAALGGAETARAQDSPPAQPGSAVLQYVEVLPTASGPRPAGGGGSSATAGGGGSVASGGSEPGGGTTGSTGATGGSGGTAGAGGAPSPPAQLPADVAAALSADDSPEAAALREVATSERLGAPQEQLQRESQPAAPDDAEPEESGVAAERVRVEERDLTVLVAVLAATTLVLLGLGARRLSRRG